VTVLDADTLADVAEVADLGGHFDARGYLGLANFAASPTDDLVLVPSSVGEPSGLRAFRLSDGTALPAPGLATLPLMFMPDGAHVLMRASGKLIVADGDSGAVLTSIADDGTAPVAVSPDGRTVAIGGRGQSLLRVWNLADPAPSAVCSVDDPGPAPTSSGPGVSLSGDGLLIAFGTGPHLRVANTNDGVVPVSFDLDDPSQGAHVLISPMKRHVATGPWPTSAFPTIVFGLQDHGRVADLPADGWRWGDLAFSPLEQQMYAIAHGTKEDRLYVASLDAPGLTSVGSFTGDYFSLLGVSQGCPVLYTGSRGAWRACGTCSDPPIGGGGAAVLSPDGGLVAMGAASPGPDVILWPMQAGATALATFAASAADIIYQPLIQVPIAIATSGGRIVTSATSAQTCYRGPSLPVRIRDMTTGVFLDALPPVPGPGGLAVDRDIHRIAYGPQLWCSD
jgi:WD40 repeat protein